MSELEDLRQQVHILEKTESLATLELSAKVRRLEAELAQAKDEARRIAEAWREADREHVGTRNRMWVAEDKLEQAEQALAERIGPLTAAEWLEFRLRPNEEEDEELLRCCANTSAIRDDIFHLMRSYADEPLLGRIPMQRIIHGINGHHDLIEGDHPAAKRLLELLTRMAAYYGVRMDYVRETGVKE